MEDILLVTLIILFTISLILIALIVLIDKKNRKIKMLESQLDILNSNRTVATLKKLSGRKNYRVKVYNCPAELTILDSEENKFKKLNGKKFDGSIEDISLSGVRIKCEYSLPVNVKFKLRINFTLKNEEFKLDALLIRKEEHFKIKSITYGIEFIEPQQEEIKRLAFCLHSLESEKKRFS
ncbi:PilZ domain-containing protein [Ornithinibacillus sp. 179-J 7C1 HS]|uniref:PilZ domain-containing protein n=1 Tax=Ornithinibacillus sp. 179-J 7C1 HS TaxID=3142384 RepID=UPI0039A0EA24